VDQAVEAERIYWYRVRSVGESGESRPSRQARALVRNILPKVTYLDATWRETGNTTFADGGTLYPTTDASGTDGWWRERNFGNNATALESGGDFSASWEGNTEDTPRLATTIGGLTPGAAYDVYAYFWSATEGQDWNLRAALRNVSGDLIRFAASIDPVAVAANFTTAPLLAESNRVLHQAALGVAIADGDGTIRVYIDDDPASRLYAGNGGILRTEYDGVGYAASTDPALIARASIPASLGPVQIEIHTSGHQAVVSWPTSHRGWMLQSQTNGLSGTWQDVEGSSEDTQVSVEVGPAGPPVFYRLRSPDHP
jgi:hypothetical protein